MLFTLICPRPHSQVVAIVLSRQSSALSEAVGHDVRRGYGTSVGTFVSGQNASVERFAFGVIKPITTGDRPSP